MELSSPFLHNALVYRVDFDITSRPYRAAILALASLACLNPIDYRNGGNPDTNFYCAIYYRAAAEAIATKDVASLMYASYIMAILNCAYEPCSWTRLVHCAQFCRTVHAFLDDQVSERYSHWVLELWYSLVRIACEQYWFKRSRSFLFDIWWWHGYASTAPLSGVKCFTTRTVISFREEPNHERAVSTLMEIREISAPFIYLGCDTQIQIRNGLFDFHVLFENFLYQARNSESIRRVDSTRELLHDTIVHVITLIERLPLHGTLLHDWFRCYYAVTAKTTSWCDSVNSEETLVKAVDTILLYASSRMLVKLFSHDLDPNEADQVEACTSALATVHLIWSAREILSKTHPSLIRRTLFWAGLILYKANNSRGNCPPLSGAYIRKVKTISNNVSGLLIFFAVTSIGSSFANCFLVSWRVHKIVLRGMQYGQSNSRGSDLWISHSRSLPGFVHPKLDSGKLKSNLRVGTLTAITTKTSGNRSSRRPDVLELSCSNAVVKIMKCPTPN